MAASPTPAPAPLKDEPSATSSSAENSNSGLSGSASGNSALSLGYGMSSQVGLTVKDIPRLEQLHRDLTADNLRLWECVNVMRCNPRLPAKRVLNDVFALSDQEFYRHYTAYADFEQTGHGALSNLAESGGCHGQKYLQHVQMHNCRLVMENARLLTVMHILSTEVGRSADEAVCSTFALNDKSFSDKYPIVGTYERVLADLSRLKEESRTGRQRSFTRSPSIFKSPLFHNSRRHSSPPAPHGPSTSNNNDNSFRFGTSYHDSLGSRGTVRLPRFELGEQLTWEGRGGVLRMPKARIVLRGCRVPPRQSLADPSSTLSAGESSQRTCCREATKKVSSRKITIGHYEPSARRSSLETKTSPRAPVLKISEPFERKSPTLRGKSPTTRITTSVCSCSPRTTRKSSEKRNKSPLPPRLGGNTSPTPRPSSRSPDSHLLHTHVPPHWESYSSNNATVYGQSPLGPSQHDVLCVEEEDEEDSVPYYKHRERIRQHSFNTMSIKGSEIGRKVSTEESGQKGWESSAYFPAMTPRNTERVFGQPGSPRKLAESQHSTIISPQKSAESTRTDADTRPRCPSTNSCQEQDFNENREEASEGLSHRPSNGSTHCVSDSCLVPTLPSPPGSRSRSAGKKEGKSVTFKYSIDEVMSQTKSPQRLSQRKSNLRSYSAGSADTFPDEKPKPMYYKPKLEDDELSAICEEDDAVPGDTIRSRLYDADLYKKSRFIPRSDDSDLFLDKRDQLLPDSDSYKEEQLYLKESRQQLMELRDAFRKHSSFASNGLRDIIGLTLTLDSKGRKRLEDFVVDGHQCKPRERTSFPDTTRTCNHAYSTALYSPLSPRSPSTSPKRSHCSKRSTSRSPSIIPRSVRRSPDVSPTSTSKSEYDHFLSNLDPMKTDFFPDVQSHYRLYERRSLSPRDCQHNGAAFANGNIISSAPASSRLDADEINKRPALMSSPVLREDRAHRVHMLRTKANTLSSKADSLTESTPVAKKAPSQTSPQKTSLIASARTAASSILTFASCTTHGRNSCRKGGREDLGNPTLRGPSSSGRSFSGWETRPYSRSSDGDFEDYGLLPDLDEDNAEIGDRMSRPHRQSSTWPHLTSFEHGPAADTIEELRRELEKTRSLRGRLRASAGDVQELAHIEQCKQEPEDSASVEDYYSRVSTRSHSRERPGSPDRTLERSLSRESSRSNRNNSRLETSSCRDSNKAPVRSLAAESTRPGSQGRSISPKQSSPREKIRPSRSFQGRPIIPEKSLSRDNIRPSPSFQGRSNTPEQSLSRDIITPNFQVRPKMPEQSLSREKSQDIADLSRSAEKPPSTNRPRAKSPLSNESLRSTRNRPMSLDRPTSSDRPGVLRSRSSDTFTDKAVPLGETESRSRSSSAESFDRDSLEMEKVEKDGINLDRKGGSKKNCSASGSEPFILHRQEPPTAVLGEVAFQLERSILRQVFHDKPVFGRCRSRSKSPAKKDNEQHAKEADSQRHRFYGYTVNNIPDKIRAESRDAETGKRDASKEARLLRRYGRTMKTLRFFGYNVSKHSKLAQDVINRYGLFYQPPDDATIERLGLHDFRSVKCHVMRLSNRSELEGMVILLDCLRALSEQERKPILSFD